MTEVGEVYFCQICGNKVEVVESGKGTLVCCGEPMKLLRSRTVKKHVDR
jgi:superoxide reductase